MVLQTRFPTVAFWKVFLYRVACPEISSIPLCALDDEQKYLANDEYIGGKSDKFRAATLSGCMRRIHRTLEPEMTYAGTAANFVRVPSIFNETQVCTYLTNIKKTTICALSRTGIIQIE